MGRLIGVVASLMVLVAVPAAHACNLPDITVSAKEAGPGDLVDFSISGTDPGAAYRVFAYGEEVLAGVDADGAGVTGRFPMPDLGESSLLAAVEVNITHPNPGDAGGDYHGGAPWWGSTRDVHYRATPPQGTKPAQVERAKPKPRKVRPPATPRKQSPVSGQRSRRRARPAEERRRKARARKRGARAQPQRQRRRRTLEEPGAGATPAAAPVPAYEPPRPVAAHEGGGMKSVMAVLALLTIGGAAYGRVSARGRRMT